LFAQLKRQHEADGDDKADEGVEDYDYDNAADAAEFCPATQDDDDDVSTLFVIVYLWHLI
jgi:hypothetical protein